MDPCLRDYVKIGKTLPYCLMVTPGLIRNQVLFKERMFLDAGSSPARQGALKRFFVLRHILLRRSDHKYLTNL